jgi:vitamin B12 transporter
MKKKFLFVAACIISSPLLAQDSTRVSFLDEVVFTANKYPNKTSLTGKVLTIISRQQLEKSGGKDLAQILNEQAWPRHQWCESVTQVRTKLCSCVAPLVSIH